MVLPLVCAYMHGKPAIDINNKKQSDSSKCQERNSQEGDSMGVCFNEVGEGLSGEGLFHLRPER